MLTGHAQHAGHLVIGTMHGMHIFIGQSAMVSVARGQERRGCPAIWYHSNKRGANKGHLAERIFHQAWIYTGTVVINISNEGNVAGV